MNCFPDDDVCMDLNADMRGGASVTIALYTFALLILSIWSAIIYLCIHEHGRLPDMPLKRSTHWNCKLCGENQSEYSNKRCERCNAALTQENTFYM